MRKKIFLDTDVILDMAYKRKPHLYIHRKSCPLLGKMSFICVNNKIIITRNIADYKNVDINIMTPQDFLNLEEIRKIIEANFNNNK